MPKDDEIRELKQELRNLKERYSMLHRFVSNINEKVNKRLKKVEKISMELVKSLEACPVEVVDVTPDGFRTPTKSATPSPVISPLKSVRSPALVSTIIESKSSCSSKRIPKYSGRRRHKPRLCPTQSQLRKILKEMDKETKSLKL